VRRGVRVRNRRGGGGEWGISGSGYWKTNVLGTKDAGRREVELGGRARRSGSRTLVPRCFVEPTREEHRYGRENTIRRTDTVLRGRFAKTGPNPYCCPRTARSVEDNTTNNRGEGV
jgi:hypothetical protein